MHQLRNQSLRNRNEHEYFFVLSFDFALSIVFEFAGRDPTPRSQNKNNKTIMQAFQDVVFRAKVDDALRTVRTILSTAKHPQRMADVPHKYDDKYGMAERAIKASQVATLSACAVLGLDGEALKGAEAWAKDNKVCFVLFCIVYL